MNARPHPLRGPNRFKLGVFSANADGGLAITDVPERWRASWDDNLITAGEFLRSSDSVISASSELGISGTIEINGPRVDVNGALVVLSSDLRGRAAVLREACSARSDRPISSLVEAGRGGLPQDPEATLPALYIAGREVNPAWQGGTSTTAASSTLQTTVRLTMRCG